MSKNDFIEPKPFSINESFLEDALMKIGSGQQPSAPANYLKNSKKDMVNSKYSAMEAAINEIPEAYRSECEKYVLGQIKRFKRHIVCKNTQEVSKQACSVGKNRDEIIYKNSSIQGDWKGLEVIIDGEDSGLTVVRAKGEDWEDVTKLFKIS